MHSPIYFPLPHYLPPLKGYGQVPFTALKLPGRSVPLCDDCGSDILLKSLK